MWLTDLRKADLNLLSVFYAVYTERNITRAGETLGLTQSGVSHGLSRLRALFGDELFVRAAGGVRPTRRAEEIAEPIRELLENCLAIVAPDNRFDPTTAKATFNVSMSDYEDYLLSPPLAQNLKGASPDLHITIKDLRPEEALAALERGGLDLVIGPFPHIPTEFNRRRLFDDELVVIARDGHPHMSNDMPLAEFVELPHLRVQFHEQGGTLFERVLSQHGESIRYVITAKHFMVAPVIVAKSDLVAVVRRETLRAATHLPIKVYPMPVPTRSFSIWAVWHHRLQSHPGLTWLVDQLSAIGREIENEAKT